VFDYYPDRPSPILKFKGQGHQGQKSAFALPIPTQVRACEWYALAAGVMQQQCAAPADESISWRASGDIGGGVH